MKLYFNIFPECLFLKFFCTTLISKYFCSLTCFQEFFLIVLFNSRKMLVQIINENCPPLCAQLSGSSFNETKMQIAFMF